MRICLSKATNKMLVKLTTWKGSLNLHKKVFVSFSYPFLSRAFSWQSPKYEDVEISSRQTFSFFISFSVERYAFLHISLASYTFFNNAVIWHTLSKRRLFWDKLTIILRGHPWMTSRNFRSFFDTLFHSYLQAFKY